MATAPEELAPSTEQPAVDENFDPFSDEDIQKILTEEKATSRDEGWTFVNRTDLAEVWRKNEQDKPVHLIKAFLSFPGIPPEKIVEMIYDLDVRKEWDKQFPVIDVAETHKNYRVVYWLVKMPPVVADRDIVQLIGQRRDEATNTTYMLYRNSSHPKYPERSGIVRGETILSGVIVRPDPEDANSTKMSVLLQNDVKGWIPHFVVNAFAARAPGKWRNDLANYYFDHYVKHGKKEKTPEAKEERAEEKQAEEEQEIHS